MNCKDYQDDLRIRAENDAAALQTKQTLEVSKQKVLAIQCNFVDTLNVAINALITRQATTAKKKQKTKTSLLTGRNRTGHIWMGPFW